MAVTLLASTHLHVYAAPHFGETFTYTQPNGESFKVQLWGDEFFAYQQTTDGYLVVRDERSGDYCYARVTPNGDSIVSTGIRVGRAKPAGLLPRQRLAPGKAIKLSMPKRQLLGVNEQGQLLPEQEAILMAPPEDEPLQNDAVNQETPITNASPANITRKVGLVLLASFPDRPQNVTKSQFEIDQYCNDPDYSTNGNATSIYGYFDIQSNGKLQYNCVVTAWFEAANNQDYYTDPGVSYSQRAKELIKEGLAKLDADGFDFNQCNADGNSSLDGVNLFYAGTRMNAWAEGLWPHKSSTSWSDLSGHGLSTSFQYQITDTPSSLGIGTFCHENGHMILNLPDLYPYDTNAARVGGYSLMSSSGSKHPNSIDAYLRITCGWAQVTDLDTTSSQRCAVQVGRNHFYRFNNPSKSGEHFIIEARGNTGYEGPWGGATGSVNPTSGLVVYHALSSGSNTNSTIVTADNPNCNYTKPYRLMVVEAAPSATVTPWYDDPTPGSNDSLKSGGISQLDDSTLPALKFWASDGRTTASGADIHTVSADGETMTFLIGAGSPTAPDNIRLTEDELVSNINEGINTASQSFAIFNEGPNTITYSVATDEFWLDVDISNGDVSTEADLVTVSYTTSGLNAGTYTATISVTSQEAANSPQTIDVTVVVDQALATPTITLHPVGTHLLGGQSHTLTSGATGFPAPSFQWYRDGVAVSGAITNTLELHNVNAADAGSYVMTAFNYLGEVSSNPAVVTVDDYPDIQMVTPATTSIWIPSNVGLMLETNTTDDGYGGSTLTLTWSAESTPAGANIQWDASSAASTGVRFDMDGDYQLRLTADDGTYVSTVDYFVTVGTSPTPVSTTGQIVHYEFRETSGSTAADSAGGDDDATLVGGASFVDGRLTLDGGTGYASIADSSLINTSGPYAKRTVCLWFKPDTIKAGRQLLFEEGGTTNGMNIRLEGTSLTVAIWNGEGDVARSASITYGSMSAITSSRWNHVAFVLDATTDGTSLQTDAFRMYVNGALHDSVPGVRVDTHSDDTGIGRVNGSTRYGSTTASDTDGFDGQVDDFRLYNRALTDQEVHLLVKFSNIGPMVDAGANQTVVMNDHSGSWGDPVAGAHYEWDAALDTARNAQWPSTTSNIYDWVFDAGPQTPAAVSDARFNTLTAAYEFPAAKDSRNEDMETKVGGDREPATFEFVLDVDGNDGVIFETGGNGDGFAMDVSGGVLRGMVEEDPTETVVSYPLTSGDMDRFIHIVLVIDNVNDLLQLYVDDQLRNSKSWTLGEDWSGSDDGGLGAKYNSIVDGGSTVDFTGKIALFRYYRNKAFSAPEVTTNYTSLFAGASAEANLNGAVNDADNNPPSTTWTVFSGPGAVFFDDAAAVVTTVTFRAPGAFTLRLLANDGLVTTFEETTIMVIPPSDNTYANYISNPTYGIDPVFRATNDDPDGDGIVNLLEAWFGTHPGEPTPGTSVFDLSGSNLTIAHPANPNPPTDLSAAYQWSQNLIDWFSGDGIDGPDGGPTATITPVTVDSTTTVTANPDPDTSMLFLRIVVGQP